ncbi:MAG TPA: hypothetical protein VGE72_01715 [Azospirillum sp.]
MRRPATAATLSFGRVRQLVLIAMGWTIIGLGLLLAPLPGPGGLPVLLVGGVILLRNSPNARRLFVRMKRRHPRLFRPVERVRTYLRERRQRRAG